MISNNIINKLKIKYPIGTRIKLIKMDDIGAPPIGSYGTVVGIDDLGSILVNWDNGSTLNVIFNEDKVEIIA